MSENLLRDTWTALDSAELRLLLRDRLGGPGQYHDRPSNRAELYFPLAGASCRIALVFQGNSLMAIEPGPAFDAAEWERITQEIEKSILDGPLKVGREYIFNSFRVPGSWRGRCSGVQILPPPDDAPRANFEVAEHPFILEFLMRASDFWPVTNFRRMRDHRRLTLLLNVLLAGRTSLQLHRSEHFWASVPRDHRRKNKWLHKVWRFFSWSRGARNASPIDHEIKWVQRFFFAKLGDAFIDELSPPAAKQLEEVEPEEYYTKVGHDGKGLRVPTDLDESICSYRALSSWNREKFDRATFWFDIASRQWNTSVSASFAALVSAIESLTERGDIHQFECLICGKPGQHEVPGATQRFKDFLETYAPSVALEKQRNDMYSLRSGILHGSKLMRLDEELFFGFDPSSWNESELHDELWSLTGVALRNWLKNPSSA